MGVFINFYGYFVECLAVGELHLHFCHEQCQSKEDIPCRLHCGMTTGLKEVRMEMHMTNLHGFLTKLCPGTKLPERRVMSSTAFSSSFPSCDPNCSYQIEETHKTLSSLGLTDSSEIAELDQLLQVLKEKADPKQYTYEELYTAVAEGNIMKVLNMLAQGINPNTEFDNHDNETALHIAAAAGYTTIVHLLIQAGATIDVPSGKLYTPLMLAVENKHQNVVSHLMNNRAAPDLKGAKGISSFHIAAKNSCLEIMKILINRGGSDKNCQDDGGRTPLVYAIQQEHVAIVKLLLHSGAANPNIKDSEGNTALHWSAFSENKDISFFCLQSGCDINAVNDQGDTPMHIAATQNNLPCVELYISRIPDVHIKNKKDQIAADCCENKLGPCNLALCFHTMLRAISAKYPHKSTVTLCRDISRGKEHHPIQCINAIDNEQPKLDFVYVTENFESTHRDIDHRYTSLQACNCANDCTSSNCVCGNISYQCWYNKKGLLLPSFNLLEPPIIFECNPACKCSSTRCRNRVLQQKKMARLQLVRTKTTGWGVRTLKSLLKGEFVCEYVGELITDSEADAREDDTYLFDLEGKDKTAFTLDAKKYGNISRFINHHCEPNLIAVKVFVNHQDQNVPHIAFFSTRDIKQYEELSFDYGEKFWVIKCLSFFCECGSANCKYTKDTACNTLSFQLKEQGLAALIPDLFMDNNLSI